MIRTDLRKLQILERAAQEHSVIQILCLLQESKAFLPNRKQQKPGDVGIVQFRKDHTFRLLTSGGGLDGEDIVVFPCDPLHPLGKVKKERIIQRRYDQRDLIVPCKQPAPNSRIGDIIVVFDHLQYPTTGLRVDGGILLIDHLGNS